MTGRVENGPPHPRLGEAFGALDRAGVDWCVLRGAGELARPRGDVDLLVARADRERAIAALRAIGFGRLPACGRGSHLFLRAYHGPSDLWITLDMVTELAYGPAFSLATGAEHGCLRRRRRTGGVAALAPDDEFWTLLLHCVLDRRTFEARHVERLEALAELASPDGPLGALLGTLTPPDWSPRRILATARRRDWQALLDLYPRLCRSWARAQLGRVLARVVARRVSRLAEKRAVWLSRRRMSVALLGPDGAGKSTLAREVAGGFCFPATTAYMGLWQGDGEASRRPLRAAGQVLLRPLTSVRRYLAARVQQERGRLVVFDRYTYDAYLPPRPPHLRAKKLYFSLLAHICPGPGLVLLLDAPADLLAARKGEHSAEELEWQRRHFLALGERLPRLQVVDATRPQHELKAELLERIWSHFCGEGAR